MTLSWGFERYFKKLNCFSFLKTEAAKEPLSIERSEREAAGERESLSMLRKCFAIGSS
jgi:hypothetical protein